MVAEEILLQKLSETAEIVEETADRIFCGIIPQAVSVYPIIVIDLVAETPTRGQSGECYETVLIQLSVLHASYGQMTALAQKIRTALHNIAGVYGSTNLISCILESTDLESQYNDGVTFVKSLDYKLIINK